MQRLSIGATSTGGGQGGVAYTTTTTDGEYVLYSDAIRAVEAEREACARAAEAGHMPWPYYQGMEFSRGCLWAGANIRARSNVELTGAARHERE